MDAARARNGRTLELDCAKSLPIKKRALEVLRTRAVEKDLTTRVAKVVDDQEPRSGIERRPGYGSTLVLKSLGDSRGPRSVRRHQGRGSSMLLVPS